jgi:hypothetical protein
MSNPYSTVAYAVPGSPYYEDILCKHLLDRYGFDVIDTKSSGQLAYELVESDLAYHHVDILRKSYLGNFYVFNIKDHAVNIISCLGPSYQKSMSWINKLYIMSRIRKQDKIYSIKIGANPIKEQLTRQQFKSLLDNKDNTMNQRTYAIVKE